MTKIKPRLIVTPIVADQEIELIPTNSFKFDRLKIKLDDQKEQWILGQKNDQGQWIESTRLQCWSKNKMHGD